MSDRQRYPSDVADEQWALIGPFLDAWIVKRISVAGRHGEQDLREIVNARAAVRREESREAEDLPAGLSQQPGGS